MKYIDAEKLITEIEALKRRKGFLPLENTDITESYMARGVQFTCDDIMNIVTSLQQEQPEVDLEKEIDAVWNPRFNLGWDEKSLLSINHSAFETVARHFYELGLNARK